MQGPKLRVGTFAEGPVMLNAGSSFRLDLTDKPGDVTRAYLPHPEIFAALKPGANLLLDDGKMRLQVEKSGRDFAETEVIVGGALSERKGVNVPDVVLPLSALTAKDRRDLEFALELGVEWLALSFVQRPEDLDEARALTRGRAGIMTKLEKPSAVEALDAIVAKSDAVMVARGDLGVELPAEKVPRIQRTRGTRVPSRGQARDRRHADAGVDDHRARADACGSLRCRNRDLSRRGCRDAFRGIGQRQVPGRSGADDGTDHRRSGSRSLSSATARVLANARTTDQCRCHLRCDGCDRRTVARRGDRHLHDVGFDEPARGARASCASDPEHDAERSRPRGGWRWCAACIR